MRMMCSRFLILLIASVTVPASTEEAISCEGGTPIVITCANPLFEYVMYGREDPFTCVGANPEVTTCAAAGALQTVQALCANTDTCVIPPTNSVFGDPCGGVSKYLRISWSCGPPPPPLCDLQPADVSNGEWGDCTGRNLGDTCVLHCADGFTHEPLSTSQCSTLGWSPAACIDVDECSGNNGDCQSICHNTEGSYYCSCETGFQLRPSGRTCSDINECEDSNDGCGTTCHNTVGSYYCSCNTGYELTADQHTCHDVDECETDNGGCDTNCENTDGSFQCSCSDGYELTGDRLTCADINECDIDVGGCSPNGWCENTPGSRNCHCNIGYEGVGTGTQGCTDIDECDTECTTGICENNAGSFTCSCERDLQHTGLACKGIVFVYGGVDLEDELAQYGDTVHWNALSSDSGTMMLPAAKKFTKQQILEGSYEYIIHGVHGPLQNIYSLLTVIRAIPTVWGAALIPFDSFIPVCLADGQYSSNWNINSGSGGALSSLSRTSTDVPPLACFSFGGVISTLGGEENRLSLSNVVGQAGNVFQAEAWLTDIPLEMEQAKIGFGVGPAAGVIASMGIYFDGNNQQPDNYKVYDGSWSEGTTPLARSQGATKLQLIGDGTTIKSYINGVLVHSVESIVEVDRLSIFVEGSSAVTVQFSGLRINFGSSCIVDGYLDETSGEQCDDGNSIDEDDCTNQCLPGPGQGTGSTCSCSDHLAIYFDRPSWMNERPPNLTLPFEVTASSNAEICLTVQKPYVQGGIWSVGGRRQQHPSTTPLQWIPYSLVPGSDSVPSDLPPESTANQLYGLHSNGWTANAVGQQGWCWDRIPSQVPTTAWTWQIDGCQMTQTYCFNPLSAGVLPFECQRTDTTNEAYQPPLPRVTVDCALYVDLLRPKHSGSGAPEFPTTEFLKWGNRFHTTINIELGAVVNSDLAFLTPYINTYISSGGYLHGDVELNFADTAYVGQQIVESKLGSWDGQAATDVYTLALVLGGTKLEIRGKDIQPVFSNTIYVRLQLLNQATADTVQVTLKVAIEALNVEVDKGDTPIGLGITTIVKVMQRDSSNTQQPDFSSASTRTANTLSIEDLLLVEIPNTQNEFLRLKQDGLEATLHTVDSAGDLVEQPLQSIVTAGLKDPSLQDYWQFAFAGDAYQTNNNLARAYSLRLAVEAGSYIIKQTMQFEVHHPPQHKFHGQQTGASATTGTTITTVRTTNRLTVVVGTDQEVVEVELSVPPKAENETINISIVNEEQNASAKDKKNRLFREALVFGVIGAAFFAVVIAGMFMYILHTKLRLLAFTKTGGQPSTAKKMGKMQFERRPSAKLEKRPLSPNREDFQPGDTVMKDVELQL